MAKIGSQLNHNFLINQLHNITKHLKQIENVEPQIYQPVFSYFFSLFSLRHNEVKIQPAAARSDPVIPPVSSRQQTERPRHLHVQLLYALTGPSVNTILEQTEPFQKHLVSLSSSSLTVQCVCVSLGNSKSRRAWQLDWLRSYSRILLYLIWAHSMVRN